MNEQRERETLKGNGGAAKKGGRDGHELLGGDTCPLLPTVVLQELIGWEGRGKSGFAPFS